MVGMIRDVEPLADEVCDPLAGPQRGAEPECLRPLENPADQRGALPGGQLGWAAGDRACLHPGAPLPAVGPLPAAHRPAIHPQALGHFVREQLVVQQHDGAESAAFQFSRAPLWAHEAAPPQGIIGHYLYRDQ